MSPRNSPGWRRASAIRWRRWDPSASASCGIGAAAGLRPRLSTRCLQWRPCSSASAPGGRDSCWRTSRSMDADRAQRQGLAGVLYALATFASWGVIVPLHFKLLISVPPPVILGQRILWASLMTLALIALLGRLGRL